MLLLENKKNVDCYILARFNNTVPFFLTDKRELSNLCLWICDQNAEITSMVLPIEINKN